MIREVCGHTFKIHKLNISSHKSQYEGDSQNTLLFFSSVVPAWYKQGRVVSKAQKVHNIFGCCVKPCYCVILVK